MKAVKISTKRLLLKRLSLEHLSKEYLSWLNDSEVTKYLETRDGCKFGELELFLKEQEKKDIFFWAIHIKETGKHIGNIKIDPIDETQSSGEYGILMGDKHEWGKGYAYEASIAVIDFCFKSIGLSQVTLGVIEDNIGALKLYEKIGFEISSVNMEHGVYGGKLCNAIRMIKRND